MTRISTAVACVGLLAAVPASAQHPVRLGSAAALGTVPQTARNIQVRVGPEEAPFQAVVPNSAGEYAVQLPAAGRILIDFGGPVDNGYQVVGDDLRPLPAGSTLMADAGQFAWAPPVPFLGPFRLEFLSGGTRVDVVATVTDPTASSEIQVQIDTPASGSAVGGPFVVAGWSLDPRAATGSGIDTLHVWAYRRDVATDPQFLGAAAIGGARPDVAKMFGAQFESAGYSLSTPMLSRGTYDLVVYAWSHRTGKWEGQRTVRVSVNDAAAW